MKEDIKMNEKLRDEFEQLSKPLIEFLNKNYHPHVTIIITPSSAELLSGEMSMYTEEYFND